LRPVWVPSKIVRPSSDRRSGHRQLALNRTDRSLMTAQDGACVVCVEHAGDRAGVAGISRAKLLVAWAAELLGTRAGATPVLPGPRMPDWMTAGGEIMSVALAEHSGPWTAE
jgi:hypothetical protein